MSITSQHYSRPARTKAQRLRTRGFHSRPRPPSHSQDPGVTSVMGPANRAPGVSIMGGPSWGLHTDVMGGPDDGPRVNIMGSGDQRPRFDLLGDSDARFVDSLFER